MTMEVEVATLEDLEEIIRDLSLGDQRVSVHVVVPPVADLFEAAPLLHGLRMQIAGSGWEVDDVSLAMLLQASEYYQSLDLMELHLDLMKMDLEDGVEMRQIRFDGIRQTANEVVVHAPSTYILDVLDNITIEGQRIARVANLLGFGADVEDAKLGADDMEWFLTGTGEEYAKLGEDDLEWFSAGTGEEVHLPGGEIGAHHEEAKEMVTRAVLLRKIRRLCEVLRRTKRGPFVV